MGHEQHSFRMPADQSAEFNRLVRLSGKKKIEIFQEIVSRWVQEQHNAIKEQQTYAETYTA